MRTSYSPGMPHMLPVSGTASLRNSPPLSGEICCMRQMLPRGLIACTTRYESASTEARRPNTKNASPRSYSPGPASTAILPGPCASASGAAAAAAAPRPISAAAATATIATAGRQRRRRAGDPMRGRGQAHV